MTSPVVARRDPAPWRVVVSGAVAVVLVWGLSAFAAWPWVATTPGEARLRLSLEHVSALAGPIETRSAEELAKLPAHMRPIEPSRVATGRRADATLTVVVDGHTVLSRTYRPTGLRHDGPIYAYEEVRLHPSRHAVSLALADEQGGERRRRGYAEEIDVGPGQAPLIEYHSGSGWRHP